MGYGAPWPALAKAFFTPVPGRSSCRIGRSPRSRPSNW